MSQFEYLIPLVSIIVGLGLADLIQSLRELVRPNRAVRWYWLTVLWAVVVFLLVLRIWWTSFSVLQHEVFGGVFAFLPYLIVFLELYLVCSFALPDPDWGTTLQSSDSTPSRSSEEPLDLESYYYSKMHRRWFFGTLIAIILSFEVVTITLLMVEENVDGYIVLADRWKSLSVVPAILMIPIVTDRRWIHGVVGGVVFGGTVLALFAASPIG